MSELFAPQQVDHGTPGFDSSTSLSGGREIDVLLRRVVKMGGSDLHLAVGSAPAVRVHGELRRLVEYEELTQLSICDLIEPMLSASQLESFMASKELDMAYSIDNLGRFRVNVLMQRGSVGAVMRVVPHEVRSLELLGMPEVVASFAELPRGLVLVTGPTGSGKSTTLASLVDIINRTKPVHIVTVEDPIEFLHHHKMAVVNQREVGTDTESFSAALKRVLRQDPDVILVGEMRDLETISTAITAAETGHLVFATLHTQDAAQTVDRIIDVFPPAQQQQVRMQLASSLQAIVTQQLIPTATKKGRAVACEVLVATSAIRNLIREGKTHQIVNAMQAGGQFGMMTMDSHLAELANRGVITSAVALERSSHPEDLRRLIRVAA